MADVLCPTCGRLNPPDREVCQHCQARLRPFSTYAGGESAGAPAASGSGSTSGAADLPDWLEEIRSGSDSAPGAGPDYGDSSNAGAEQVEEPDWLRRIRRREAEAIEKRPSANREPQPEQGQSSTSGQGAPEAGDQAPDWLTNLAGGTSPEEKPKSDLSWMSEISGAPGQEQPASNVPDWLSSLVSKPPAPGEGETLPDWLVEEPGEAEAEGHPGVSALQGEDLPSWLAELTTPAPDLPPPQEPGEAAPPAEIPSDWLPSVGPLPVEEPLAPKADEPEPFYGEDLSEWLGASLQPGAKTPPGAEPKPGITPAELPGWLEAMRPVEEVTPVIPLAEGAHAVAESAGPLAGLRGVLSAEPATAQLRKTTLHSARLQVSENQRSHIDLLARLVKTEGEARAIPARPILSPQHMLRMGIALVLLLALLWSILLGGQRTPLPALSPEVISFNQYINELPSQSRVLLAFDYEPSLSGEMDAAAYAVLDHLMLRGAFFTVVSTLPAGPIVAERALRTGLSGHNYASGEQYVNLGYIPGGSTGLLNFAESPQRTVPFTLEGRPAWERQGRLALPPLQGINSLDEFALVLVIAENPDTARIWVEQVQPYLEREDGQVPLLMVVSAQAEPLLRPYYDAKPSQIQGLVTGLRGGAAYARMTGREGPARAYWDAFGVGLVVAALLIAVGGVFNLISFALAERARVAPSSHPGSTKDQALEQGEEPAKAEGQP